MLVDCGPPCGSPPLHIRRTTQGATEEDRLKLHHFFKETRIDAAPETVFAFHESPGVFRKLVPPWEDVRVESEPAALEPGSRVVLRTKFGPFSMRWVAEHTEYIPGKLFADRQVSGPFAYWYHRHQFEPDGQGGTLLRDEVEFRLPLGRLGELLALRFVESRLKRMFDFRHAVTKEFIESGEFRRSQQTEVRGPDQDPSVPGTLREPAGPKAS